MRIKRSFPLTVHPDRAGEHFTIEKRGYLETPAHRAKWIANKRSAKDGLERDLQASITRALEAAGRPGGVLWVMRSGASLKAVSPPDSTRPVPAK